MRILILGGTIFLGRALVDAALRRGHQLTLFNRGQSSPEAYPDIETIHGDRESDLERLRGRRWDAAIDTCGYFPRQPRLSTAALRKAVDQYAFISTLSVYPTAGEPNRDETSPLLPAADDSVDEMTGGELRSAESRLRSRCQAGFFPGSALIIRAGLIVGPYDPTNRFTYWVRRAARGGDAIAPPAAQPLQFIDARDLAAFVLDGVRSESRRNLQCHGAGRAPDLRRIPADDESGAGQRCPLSSRQR